MQALLPSQSPTASNFHFSSPRRKNGDLLLPKKHTPSSPCKTLGVYHVDHDALQIALKVEPSELFELETQAEPLEMPLEILLLEIKLGMERGKLLETILVTQLVVVSPELLVQ